MFSAPPQAGESVVGCMGPSGLAYWAEGAGKAHCSLGVAIALRLSLVKCIPANRKYSVISSGFPSMVDNQLTAAIELIAKSLNPVISSGSARQMTMSNDDVSRYALISPNTSWKSTAVAARWCRGSRWLPRWTI